MGRESRAWAQLCRSLRAAVVAQWRCWLCEAGMGAGSAPLSRKPSGLSVRRCQHETGCVRERAWGSAAERRRRHGWRGGGAWLAHALGRCGLEEVIESHSSKRTSISKACNKTTLQQDLKLAHKYKSARRLRTSYGRYAAGRLPTPTLPLHRHRPPHHSPLTFHPNLTLHAGAWNSMAARSTGDAPKAGQLQGDRTSLFLSN